MIHNSHKEIFAIGKKRSTIFLACFFLSGLISGFLSAGVCTSYPFLLMRSVINYPVSIVCSLCVYLIPLLISAFAVSFQIFWLTYLIAFVKAYSFAFTGICLQSLADGVGIYTRAVLLFPPAVLLPFLYYYWYTSLCYAKRGSFGMLLKLLCLAIVLGYVDYAYIMPIWHHI